MTIWKFCLEVTDYQCLDMPRGAHLLSVQTQDGVPQLWAIVDPSAVKENRFILTVGTGNPMPAGCGSFLGTYQLYLGKQVYHVFEGLPLT